MNNKTIEYLKSIIRNIERLMEWVFVGKDTEQSKAELTDHRETSDSLENVRQLKSGLDQRKRRERRADQSERKVNGRKLLRCSNKERHCLRCLAGRTAVPLPVLIPALPPHESPYNQTKPSEIGQIKRITAVSKSTLKHSTEKEKREKKRERERKGGWSPGQVW